MDEDSQFDGTRISSLSPRDNFIRELEQRLLDGCSVTFTISHDEQPDTAQRVLRRLREHGWYTAYVDLQTVSSVERLVLTVVQAYIQLRTGDMELPASSLDAFLGDLSRVEVHDKIEDILDLDHLTRIKESAFELLDEVIDLGQRIGETDHRRLVVWFDEWQEIARMKDGDLLLKRLRGMFQLQTHVTYAFTGSRDPDLLKTLFADRHQPLYRFAVRVDLNE
ncbi:hypothetical protein [Alicyclobacillus mengziensis]|uniref:Uncharacterized protein n=1 Tax=Alicyclobacillus mengziensis TaxID=2931921 RepID=A0A9X7Z8L9_9BACL|nr:hypothetical protein [Alicyclobacillus mengziensis]QSO48468.1 hypothetical protein JZ786_05620 [Alicyclobacillus mengziensis]